MKPSDRQMERVVALLKAMEPQEPEFIRSLPCEITACIPCHDAWCWASGSLNSTLNSLEAGAQSVPLKLVLCDNGSEDGTQVFLNELSRDTVTRAYWLKRFPSGIQIAEPVPVNEEYQAGQKRINAHMKVIHPRMLALVDTEYVLTIDADVDAPRGGLRTMLDALKNDPELWMVGIKYDAADHIQHGLTMMQTERRRELRWGEDGCTCRFLFNELRRMGKRVVELSPLSARHTARERG